MSFLENEKTYIQGWGNYPRAKATRFKFANERELKSIIGSLSTFISRGNGRSYGDSALNASVIEIKPYNKFLQFDDVKGILRCQAGVLLAEILEIIVPKGWFLPVTPGTKFITVGGAIAADIHGKNHHNAGSFSEFVVDFSLMLPDGEVISCSPFENRDFFRATCGGMGLTGVILEATIKLKKINSSLIDQITIKTKNLKETFEAFEQYQNYTYSVAWIDCLASNAKLGRSILMVGEHADDGNLLYSPKNSLDMPVNMPSFFLNNYTVKLFNKFYYRYAGNGINQKKVKLDTFFYPLDTIGNWNRIYGRKGFTQYQFVLPLSNSYEGLKEMLEIIANSGKGSFLAVLKLLGKGNDNWLSFPMEGYTLALDFKIEPELFSLLDELDRIVMNYGGRFYLAKDARVSRATFEQGYEHINKFRTFRKKHGFDERIQSLQSKRLEI